MSENDPVISSFRGGVDVPALMGAEHKGTGLVTATGTGGRK